MGPVFSKFWDRVTKSVPPGGRPPVTYTFTVSKAACIVINTKKEKRIDNAGTR
jgi:hypothetical protein